MENGYGEEQQEVVYTPKSMNGKHSPPPTNHQQGSSSSSSSSKMAYCEAELKMYCANGSLDSIKKWLICHQPSRKTCESEQCHCGIKLPWSFENKIPPPSEIKNLLVSACLIALKKQFFFIVQFFIENSIVDRKTNMPETQITLIDHLVAETNQVALVHSFLKCRLFCLCDDYEELFCTACEHANYAMVRMFLDKKEGSIIPFLSPTNAPTQMMNGLRSMLEANYFIRDPNMTCFRLVLSKLCRIAMTAKEREYFGEHVMATVCRRLVGFLEPMHVLLSFMEEYYLLWSDNPISKNQMGASHGSHARDCKTNKRTSVFWELEQDVFAIQNWQTAWKRPLCLCLDRILTFNHSHISAIQLLRHHGVPITKKSVSRAIQKGSIDHIQYLISENVLLFTKHELMEAVTSYRESVVCLLLTKANVEMHADALQHIVSQIIKYPNNSNKKWQLKYPGIAECLIRHGADVDALDEMEQSVLRVHFFQTHIKCLARIVHVLDETLVQTNTYDLETTFVLVVLRDIVLRCICIEAHELKQKLEEF
jgi:hypothetical protein